jgi:hypothetical protein
VRCAIIVLRYGCKGVNGELVGLSTATNSTPDDPLPTLLVRKPLHDALDELRVPRATARCLRFVGSTAMPRIGA